MKQQGSNSYLCDPQPCSLVSFCCFGAEQRKDAVCVTDCKAEDCFLACVMLSFRCFCGSKFCPLT